MQYEGHKDGKVRMVNLYSGL